MVIDVPACGCPDLVHSFRLRVVNRGRQPGRISGRCSRMSLSRRTRLFPRRCRSNSRHSSVVSASERRPSPRSACLIQLRIHLHDSSNSAASCSGLLPGRASSAIFRQCSGGNAECFLGIVNPSLHEHKGVHATGASSIEVTRAIE